MINEVVLKHTLTQTAHDVATGEWNESRLLNGGYLIASRSLAETFIVQKEFLIYSTTANFAREFKTGEIVPRNELRDLILCLRLVK